MKYVIFESPDGRETVRVFDEITSHNEVRAEVHSGKPGLKVKSAGQLRLTVTEHGGAAPYCVVGSVTLGIPFSVARSEEDTKIVGKIFRFEA